MRSVDAECSSSHDFKRTLITHLGLSANHMDLIFASLGATQVNGAGMFFGASVLAGGVHQLQLMGSVSPPKLGSSDHHL